MAFVPRLPSFTTALAWYQYDPIGGDWSIQLPITGQIYTPLRNQDDEIGGLLYFMYPKETDLLHDVYDYDDAGKSDVIIIEFPTGSGNYRGYKVREVSPRWLKFPNEHMIASLERMTEAELLIVSGGVVPGTYLAIGQWTIVTEEPPGIFRRAWTVVPAPAGDCGPFLAGVNNSAVIHYTGLDVTIPSTATIDGLEQLWHCQSTIVAAGLCFDELFMMNVDPANFFWGNREEPSNFWPAIGEDRIYGSPIDGWGGNWNPARAMSGSPQLDFAFTDAGAGPGNAGAIVMGDLRIYYHI